MSGNHKRTFAGFCAALVVVLLAAGDLSTALAQCVSYEHTPQLVHRTETFNTGYRIILDGSTAYWFGAHDGPQLRAFDVSDPVNPYELWNHNYGGSFGNAVQRGDRFYLTNYDYPDGGLALYDIPSRTIIAESIFARGVPRSLAVDDDGLAYTCQYDTVTVAQASGSEFIVLNRFATEAFGWGLTLAYPFLYVAMREGGVQVFDVSNPLLPISLATIPTEDEAWSTVLLGHYLLVANGYGGLLVVDVQDPGTPTQVGELTELGEVRLIALAGTEAFVATNEDKIHIVDVSDPENPVRTRGFGAYLGVNAIDGPYLYNAHSGFNVFRHTGTNEVPTFGATEPPEGWINDFHARGTLAVTTEDDGWIEGWVRCWDVSQPQAPQPLGACELSPRSRISIKGDFAYAWYGEGHHVHVVDASDPMEPQYVDSLFVLPSQDDGWCLNDYTQAGNYTFALAHRSSNNATRIRTLLFTDPAIFEVVDELILPFSPHAISYDGNLAVAMMALDPGSTATRLIVMDMTVGSQAILCDQEMSFGPARAFSQIVLAGQNVYLHGNPLLAAVDVSNPLSPVITSIQSAPRCYARRLAVCEQILYVTGGALGVYAYDISDPDHPMPLGAWNTPSMAYTIAPAGELLLCTDMRALAAGPLACPGVSGLPGSAPETGPSALQVWGAGPGGRTHLQLILDRRADPRLDLIDVTGRRLWTYDPGLLLPGQHHLTWDGRDARGHRTSSGIYYAVLSIDGSTEVVPFLSVR